MKYIMYLILLSAVLLVSACGAPNEQSVLKAQEFLNKGETRLAIITLKKVLQNNANDRDARVLLAKVYLPLGDGYSAEKELLRAKGLGLENEIFVVLMSDAFLLQGNPEESLALLKKHANFTSDQSLYSALLGKAYFNMRNILEAQEAFDKAVVLNRRSLEGLMGQAKIYLIKNERNNAKQIIKLLMDLYPLHAEVRSLAGDLNSINNNDIQAEKEYLKSIKLQTIKQVTRLSFIVKLKLAKTLIKLNKLEEALKEIQYLNAHRPNNKDVKYLRAVIAFKNENYTIAFDNLIISLAGNNNDTQSNLLMSATHIALEQFEQARVRLLAVLAYQADHIMAKKMLASVYFKLNLPEKAFNILPEISDNSSNNELLALLGKAAVYGGDIDKGINLYKRIIDNDPGKDEIRIDLAGLYVAKGEFNRAIQELSDINDNTLGKANKIKILAYVRKGDYKHAMGLISDIEKNLPEDPSVNVIKGAIYLNQGERQKANNAFIKAFKINDAFYPALFNLARMAYSEGDLLLAEDWYKKVLQTDQSNLIAMSGLAQIYEKRNDIVAAKDWMVKAVLQNPEALYPVQSLVHYYIKVKQYNSAAKLISNYSKNNNESVALIRLKLKLSYASNLNNDVILQLNKLVDLQPLVLNNYLQLAQLYVKNIEWSNAENILESAKKALGESLQLNIALSQLAIKTGHYNQSIQYIDKIFLDEKNTAIAHGLMGDLYMQQMKFKAAVNEYRKGIKENKHYRYLAKLISAQITSGKIDDAKITIKLWIKEKAVNLKEYRVFALLYLQLKDQGEAIKLYEFIVEHDKKDIIALNNLAWLYQEVNDSRALITAKKAFNLAENTASVVDTYAWALLLNGDIDKAIEYLNKALQLDPSNIDIKLHMIGALTESNKGKNKAKGLLQEILKELPSLNKRKDVRMLLKTHKLL